MALYSGTDFFWGAEAHNCSPQRGSPQRTNYGYLLSPTWGTNELYWGYLQGQKWLKDSYITKLYPAWLRTLKLGTCPSVHSLQAGQHVENVLPKSLSWSEHFLDSSAGFVSSSNPDECCVFHSAAYLRGNLRNLFCVCTHENQGA